jgi:glyoxylase-like metal-dependent hydrolase (beta-lactamase superfamily II)
MEIEPGIHQLTIGREPFAGFPPPNAFLACGKESSVLIDAGWDDEDDHRQRVAYLDEAGTPPLSELIITHRHPDHGGGASRMAQAMGVKLTCQPLDREVIEKERLQGKAPIAEEVGGGRPETWVA